MEILAPVNFSSANNPGRSTNHLTNSSSAASLNSRFPHSMSTYGPGSGPGSLRSHLQDDRVPSGERQDSYQLAPMTSELSSPSSRGTAAMFGDEHASFHPPNHHHHYHPHQQQPQQPDPPASHYPAQTNSSIGPHRTEHYSEPPEQRTPRPPNAWILYRSQKFRELQQNRDPQARSQNTGKPKSQAEISRIISQMWQNEAAAVRQEFEALADEKKLEHQRMYPTYRYRPRKRVKSGRRSPGQTQAQAQSQSQAALLPAQSQTHSSSSSGRLPSSPSAGGYDSSSYSAYSAAGGKPASPTQRSFAPGQPYPPIDSLSRDSVYRSNLQHARRPPNGGYGGDDHPAAAGVYAAPDSSAGMNWEKKRAFEEPLRGGGSGRAYGSEVASQGSSSVGMNGEDFFPSSSSTPTFSTPLGRNNLSLQSGAQSVSPFQGSRTHAYDVVSGLTSAGSRSASVQRGDTGFSSGRYMPSSSNESSMGSWSDHSSFLASNVDASSQVNRGPLFHSFEGSRSSSMPQMGLPGDRFGAEGLAHSSHASPSQHHHHHHHPDFPVAEAAGPGYMGGFRSAYPSYSEQGSNEVASGIPGAATHHDQAQAKRAPFYFDARGPPGVGDGY